MIDNLGTFGPLLLFLLSIYVLWGNATYYILGFVINTLLNVVLKQIIKQPRPDMTIERFKFETFGMPSGHSQSVAFSTVFTYLSTQTQFIYLYVLISIITMVQRLVYNHHTFLQVLVGGLVGSMFAYSFYHLRRLHYRPVL
jgi:membrane-associated phospholipid phosphatase